MPNNLNAVSKQLNSIGADLIKMAGGGITKIVRNEMIIGANLVRNTIMKSMQNTPQNLNISYKRGKNSHNPSMADNAPAIDTGELIKGVLFDVKDDEFEVGDIPIYGEYLENAKKDSRRRPHVKPAMDKHREDIISKLQEVTGREIESSLKDNIKFTGI